MGVCLISNVTLGSSRTNESVRVRREINDELYEHALARHEQCLEILGQLSAKPSVADTISNLGIVACRRGEQRRAITLLVESLAMFRAMGDKRAIAEELEFLADMLLIEHPARAVRLFGAASALHEITGFQLDPADPGM
jgi:hypothetical protein